MQLVQLIAGGVILLCLGVQPLHQGGVAAVQPLGKLREPLALRGTAEGLGTGADDQNLFVVIFQRPAVGNLCGAPTVQAGDTIHLHHVSGKGHGGAGADGFQEILGDTPLTVDALAGVAVGHRDQETALGIFKPLPVKGKLLLDVVEQEVEAHHAPVACQTDGTDVSLVVAVAQIDFCGAANLAGHIVVAVQRTGRGTDGGLQVDAVFHQHIQHTGGIAAPEGATLQHKTAGHNGIRCFLELNAVIAGPGFLLFVIHLCHGFVNELVRFGFQPADNGLTAPHHGFGQFSNFFFHRGVLLSYFR